MDNIGALIRSKRKRARVKQLTLAKDCNVTATHLSQVERGIQTPSITLLRAICITLCTTLQELLTPLPEGQFNYVIARPWTEDGTSLCIYAYGKDVFHGTIEDARSMRDFINGRCAKGEVYSIYRIHQEPIE